MGGAGAGLSGLSGDAEMSEDEEPPPRRGETGTCDRVGLTANVVEVELLGEVGVALRLDEDAGDGDDVADKVEGVPEEKRPLGDTENVGGILRPNRASNSLHTAKLRLMPSDPAVTPNTDTAAASVPFASS